MHACRSSSAPSGQSMKPSHSTWSSIHRYRPCRSGVGHAKRSIPSVAGGHSIKRSKIERKWENKKQFVCINKKKFCVCRIFIIFYLWWKFIYIFFHEWKKFFGFYFEDYFCRIKIVAKAEHFGGWNWELFNLEWDWWIGVGFGDTSYSFKAYELCSINILGNLDSTRAQSHYSSLFWGKVLYLSIIYNNQSILELNN